MNKKLKIKLEFDFDDQEDFPDFDISEPETPKKKHNIKIIDSKSKRKNFDSSTKLF